MFHLLLSLAALSDNYAGDAVYNSLRANNARACFEAAEAREVNLTAMVRCDSALEDNLSRSDTVATYVNRGILSLIDDDYSTANQNFDRALQLNPKEPEAYLNKAFSLYQQGQSEAALPLIEQAIALGPRRPELAYYVRGLVRERVGDVRGAYGDLQRARQLAPNWNEPLLQLSRYQVRRR